MAGFGVSLNPAIKSATHLIWLFASERSKPLSNSKLGRKKTPMRSSCKVINYFGVTGVAA